MTQAQLQRRIPYLDILRVLACFLVILIHTPIRPYDIYYNTPSVAGAVYTVLVAVNCNLFFMITGALLLPVTMPTKKFFKRRLRVVFFPLIVWTLIYLCERAFLLHCFTPRLLTSILFHPVEGVLWYVYVLLVEAAHYHDNMFGAFSNYYGYVLLGYYMHHYGLPVFTRKHGWKFGLFFIFGIVIMPLFEFLVQGHFHITWQEHLDTLTTDISINNVAMAALLFALVQHFAPKQYDRKNHPGTATWWPRLSMATFGIYLSQMIVLRHIVWPMTYPWLCRVHWVIDCLVSGVLAFVICLLLVLLIRRFPFSKYIVGK